MEMVIRTTDVHVGGTPLRFITDGFPAPHGDTMAEKREQAAAQADDLRRLLMLEPRGHCDMRGAVFTEPVSAGADAGLLSMDADGFGEGSAAAAMAAAAIALDRRLIVPRGNGRQVRFDMPAGSIAVEWLGGTLDTDGATMRATMWPSQVVAGGVELAVADRRVRADIADAGERIAIVDAESAGVPLDLAHVPELRRTARAIAAALDEVPGLPRMLDAVVYTGPAHHGPSAMRLVRVSRRGVVGRSPTGTGIAAVLTVLDAMGVIDLDPLGFEGLSGTVWSGRIAGRGPDPEMPQVVASLDAAVWLTGEHVFTRSQDDPLADGLCAD